MWSLPQIDLLSKDSKSEENTTTESTKLGIHQAVAGAPSVEDSTASLDHLHISDTKSNEDSNIEQQPVVKITDNTSSTPPQLDNDTDSSNKPNVCVSRECDTSDKQSDHKLHQTEASSKVISGGPKVNTGPKHYGAPPVQKLPPREKVMSALLQWKTSETVRFLAGALPDYSKNDDGDTVSNKHVMVRPINTTKS